MNQSFYAGREQTLIKHKLLQRYLQAATPILGSWVKDFYYVDCLAGPWQNVDPTLSDTSFAVALEVLRNTRPTLAKRGCHPTMRALLVERDKERFARLSTFSNNTTDIDVTAKNWDFETEILPIVRSVKNRRDSFPFFFIDPTGWECCAIPLIKPILEVAPGEVLINLMTSWINRFLQDPTKPFAKLLGPGFERILTLSGDEREAAIVHTYAEAVRKAGNFPYVCTMPVLKSTDEAFHFHMVYATRHTKGVEEFKKAEGDVVPFMQGVHADAKQDRQLQKTGQHLLFGASDTYTDERYRRYRNVNLRHATEAVSASLSANSVVPFDDLWATWMQFACVQDDDLQIWLRDAVRSEKILVRNQSLRAIKVSRGNNIFIERIGISK